MNNNRIIIIENEQTIAMDMHEILELNGYNVCAIGMSAEDALDMADNYNPDLILMDIILDSEKDGITAVEGIKKKHDIPVVFITAHSDDKTFKI